METPWTKNPQHTDYDGRAIKCSHLGIRGRAWVTHAWDDWYYCHVDGIARNGNHIDGIFCRERADVIARYLTETP